MALYRRTCTHAVDFNGDLYLCGRSCVPRSQGARQQTKQRGGERGRTKRRGPAVERPLRWPFCDCDFTTARARVYRRLKCRLAAISGINGRVKSHSVQGECLACRGHRTQLIGCINLPSAAARPTNKYGKRNDIPLLIGPDWLVYAPMTVNRCG